MSTQRYPAREAAIRAHWRSHSEAMVEADVPRLDGLLADGFTLTHMTGQVQSKSEWLADIAAGEMRYHSITDAHVTIDASVPSITIRTRTDATIWGFRGQWRLQLRILLSDIDADADADADGSLVAVRTIASTW